MAFRRPVWFNTITNSITDMTDAMIEDISVRAVYVWSLNPSISLQVVNNNGSLDSMRTTYRVAGDGQTSATAYPATDPGYTATVLFDKIDTVAAASGYYNAPADTNDRAFPVYRDADNNLRAMTLQDFYDTFIDAAVGMLVEENVTNLQAGTYEISGPDDMSGYTNLGEVYADYYPNVSAYTASGIPEELVQTLATEYHLHRRNWVGAAPDVGTFPLCLTDGGHLKSKDLSYLDPLLEAAMRNQTRAGTGNRVVYNIVEEDQNGNIPNGYAPRGSAMLNTNTTEVIDRVRFVDANDYRSQEHPKGTPSIQNTYYLTIRRY